MQPRDLHRSRAAFQELQLARSKGTSCWKAAVGLLLVAAVIWAHAATGTRDSTHDGHRESEVMGRVKSWAQAEVEGAQPQTTPAPDVTPKLPASRPVSASRCGDGRCEPPETSTSCGADCPGVTTPPQCGEEPHSDPGGHAVVWGASHKVGSACLTNSTPYPNPNPNPNPTLTLTLPLALALALALALTLQQGAQRRRVLPTLQRARGQPTQRQAARSGPHPNPNLDPTPNPKPHTNP